MLTTDFRTSRCIPAAATLIALLFATLTVRAAAPDCPGSGNLAVPCNAQPDTSVRQQHSGVVNAQSQPIEPRDVAVDLGATVPSYLATETWYQVFLNTAASNGRLLIFAPGSGGQPQNTRRFTERAAEHGYHVVGMGYWNSHDDAVPELCDGDDACITGLFEGMFRNLNALFSVHTTTPSGRLLNAADPLQNRLRMLLRYLSKSFPQGGWEQFSPDGTANGYNVAPYIAWDKVTLAGHSTGSKLMAHMAQKVAVNRLIMLSGPNLLLGGATGDCPTSIAPTDATPPSRMYAYYNKGDPHYKRARTCLKAMGVYQLGVKSIDAPYDTMGAHVIVNDRPEGAINDCGSDPGDQAHISTSGDCALTLSTGSFVPSPRAHETYKVWDYLLTR